MRAGPASAYDNRIPARQHPPAITTMNNFTSDPATASAADALAARASALLAAEAPGTAERGERLHEIIAGLGLQPEIAAAARLLPAHASGELDLAKIEAACGSAVAELCAGAASLPRP